MYEAIHDARDGRLARGTGYWVGAIFLAALIGILAVHALGACLDFVTAVRYPYQLDYGEGIVWQQAALIPGPRMYAAGQGLPFIVFHYPPLFHLVARAAAEFMPDLLAAGRVVSAISAVSIAPLVASLVLVAARSTNGRRHPLVHIAIAVAAGMLALGLHATRSWGLVMRVDMLSIALGLAGVLVAAWADGRLWGTACALLLCVASVYCKQTQLPAGAAVFLVVLLRRPRAAIGAGGVALTVGLAVLALLQWRTAGGFLQNIVGGNINRFALRYARDVFLPEHSSFPFMVLMLIAAWMIVRGLAAPAAGLEGRHLFRIRLEDRGTAARAMLLLHFVFASLMLITVFKSGGGFNYLLDWLCVGCVLIGVASCDLADSGQRLSLVRWLLVLFLPLTLPYRQMPDPIPQAAIDWQDAVTQRIAKTDKPVASEDMTLLMRAGKPVIFEPAIATELALLGRWDEGPLVNMIESGGFAFMITTDNVPGETIRRTEAVDAAMHRAYPRVEQVGPALWLHLPPG
jgi:hypothetical protein